jgi:hypothetical protein
MRRWPNNSLIMKKDMTTRRENPAKKPAERVVVVTHVFDAPRERMWKAWTDPERVKRWWGPKGFTAPFCKIDLSRAGAYHSTSSPRTWRKFETTRVPASDDVDSTGDQYRWFGSFGGPRNRGKIAVR